MMDCWKSMFYSVILCATCFLIGNKQPASKAFLGGFTVFGSRNHLCTFGFKEIPPGAHHVNIAA